MANNIEKQLKEISERLEQGVKEIFTSERYTEYLNTMSKFHNYSFNNTLLITMQKPEATLVAGYQAWQKKFNRHVKRGEKGIQIIAPAPIREKQEIEKIDPVTKEPVIGDDGQPETEIVEMVIPRFRVTTVFDVSQTEGEPIAELEVSELTGSVQFYDTFMEALQNISPVPIRIDKRSLFTPSEAVAVEQHSTTPHVSRTRYGTARIEGRLSSPNARVPAVISQHCGGITVKGHTLKSFAYTTDAAIIRNTNANAILAVYPFTGEPVITQALLTVAQMPLFVGVGGGTTTGPRVTELAMVAEMQGAAGVVINAPAPAETIETTMSMVDIPVIATVTEDDEITECKILAGAAIINVAAGARTAQVVASIRAHHPEIPILASGGGSEDRILATIEAGADAITWTPPSAQQLQSQMMAKYRGEA